MRHLSSTMSILRRGMVTLACVLACLGAARGQALPSLENDFRNVFSAVPRTDTPANFTITTTQTITLTPAIGANAYRATIAISGVNSAVGTIVLATANRVNGDVIELNLSYASGSANPGISVRNAAAGGSILLDLPAPGFPGSVVTEFFRFNAGAWSRVQWPPRPSPLDTLGAPTLGQFENGTAFGGWQTTRITSNADGTGTVLAGSPTTTPGVTTLTLPSGGGVRLASVVMARPLVSLSISYSLGSEIPPPDVTSTGSPAPTGFYLAQPANTYTDAPINTVLNDKFYFSPHAQKVYATQPGVISIVWKERVSGATFSRTYIISTAPAKPERKIFWTEKGFSGPKVQVPPSRVSAVNIVYNSLLPRTVAVPFISPYETPPVNPNQQLPAEYRTLWFDPLTNLIQAYNAEGRVFVEYLGNPTGGTTREQLGYEIVNVIKEVQPTTLSVDIGEVVGPTPDQDDGSGNLSADPALRDNIISGLNVNAQPYVYVHNSQGGTRRTLYAIKQTAPGVFVNGNIEQTSNEVLIYWLEPGERSIYWPKHYNGYLLDWPVDRSRYSQYARPDQASGDSQATGVALNSANNPALVYQDDPFNQHATLAAGNLFYTNVTAASPTGRSLIRYTSGDDIWFERVYSFLNTTQPGYAGTYRNLISGVFDGNLVTWDQSLSYKTGSGTLDVSLIDTITGAVYQQGVDFQVAKAADGSDVLQRFYDLLVLDGSFPAVASGANGAVRAVAVQPDGKVLIGGDFTQVNGVARNRIARLNVDGSLDDSFLATPLTGVNGTVRSIAVASTGRVVVGGTFTQVNGVARSNVARLNSDGSLDTTFAGGAAGWVRAVAVQADGKVVIGGDFTSVNSVSRANLARFNSNGTLDTGFVPLVNNYVSCLAIQRDGAIVFGGIFNAVNGIPRRGVARMTASGSLDGTFTVTGNTDTWVWSLAIQADGKVIAGGDFGMINGVARNRIARLNANGTVDAAFLAPPLGGVSGTVSAVAVQADGRILIGGGPGFTTVNGLPRSNLARLNANGTIDTSFQEGASGSNAEVFALAVAPDAGVIVGGAFTAVNGVSANGVARFEPASPRVPNAVTLAFDNVVAFADVGERILPPESTGASTYRSGSNAVFVGYIRQASGNAYHSTAYKDPFVNGFEEAARGAIIPVNALPGNDKLEIWWYRRSQPPGTLIAGTYWPSFVQTYNVRWPIAPSEIVLASNRGSDDLPSLQASGSIYRQAVPTLPGYNPNEEHALMINGRAWALRDDLNVPTSSQPHALIAYTEADGRPAMRVFKVRRENATYTFNYDAVAGVPLQAPMPLPVLPVPIKTDFSSANYEYQPSVVDGVAGFAAASDTNFLRYQRFTFTDRKGGVWVYRGPHNGNVVSPAIAPTFRMRYFYKTQATFDYPGIAQPAVGTNTPYLRAYVTPGDPNSGFIGDPVTGTAGGEPLPRPLDIVFTPKWPASVPELRVGETLTVPKYGLPAARGQTSAELIYQQSIALDTTVNGMANRKQSARLIDPTVAKSYPLSPATLPRIPASVKTSAYLGKTYFPNLPPHLSQRLYFDPAANALIFKGQFQDDPTGEKYLLLNVLSEAEIIVTKDLCATGDELKTQWDAAIAGLKVTASTYIQDPARRGTFIVDQEVHPRFEPDAAGVPVRIPANSLPTRKPRVIGVAEPVEIFYSDTAVDSYAVSAVGGGAGYVVLAVGNGEASTPPDEPVSLKVFRVTPPLYRGELKPIASANPLDEKFTLQHTGDFAGRPQDYDFEWRYAPPVDGAAPVLYSFSRTLLLGDSNGSSQTEWRLIQNPSADYAKFRAVDADVSSAIPVQLPTEQIVVNNGAGTTANGTTLPHALLRRTFNVTGLPIRLFLSLSLGIHDGVAAYVNGAPVASYRVPGNVDSIPTSAPGPDYSPLPFVFEIPIGALVVGNNTLTLDLYSDADPNTTTSINARLEGSVESENLAAWLALSLSPGETAGETPGAAIGKVRHVISGASILTLTDNYFTVRYRAKQPNNAAYASVASGGGWSRWVTPALAEGWIKRVLGGINPFQQRITDLFNNPVNTSVSLLTQAGKRWEGDVALNLQNIDDFGLIEIYETVLRRGQELSIRGTPPINYPGANDALLLAAGYLSDLYMLLGNEAFSDAANPTIAYSGVLGGSSGNVATSLFAFKGQVATVLEEELGMLRGRDDFLQPGTSVSPAYNRFYWNYTRGIDSGEAIYALNYNIRDVNLDGAITAADAAILYPQGHGDAYGHYLTALTGYYGLLTNSNFSWTPRSEAVLVLGQAVQVDYMDERKFATAAAALVRTANQVVDLSYRQQYSAAATGGWSHLRDGRFNSRTNKRRDWGADEWASRGGQGAFFHWVTCNSLLPAVDPDPSHEGIQKIDRTTVPELGEIVAQAKALQQSIDIADARLNPLGLSRGAMLFDIDPTFLDVGSTAQTGSAAVQGLTHFDQIYERAKSALKNAVVAFNNAQTSSQVLREQEDSLDELRSAIAEQEQSFTNQLIEIYGTPYTDDIGPGKTYPQGWTGPDLVHYMYVKITEELTQGYFTPIDETEYTLMLDLNPGKLMSAMSASDALATATASVDSTGRITSIAVTGGGSGYRSTEPPTVLIKGKGSGASATATVDGSGKVTGITVVNAGSGYKGSAVSADTPFEDVTTVSISPPGIRLPVNYTLGAISGNFRTPANWTGRRASPGRMQTAVSDLLLARQELFGALYDFDRLVTVIRQQIILYQSAVTAHNGAQTLLNNNQIAQSILESLETAAASAALIIETSQGITERAENIVLWGLPLTVGTSTDPSFPARAAWAAGTVATWGALDAAQVALEIAQKIAAQTRSGLERELEMKLATNEWTRENTQLLHDLRESLQHYIDISGNIDATLRRMDQAERDLQALQAEGERLQQQRLVFRQRSASVIQGFRTRDFAFRAFRNEALDKYKTLFDLAGRYTYLAASAYDYETGLLDPDGSSVARTFYEQIVKSRALGVIVDGQPQFGGASTGDPGLSGVLARMAGDWSVVKTRFGLNNPDPYRTTFSLRQENFRIVNGPNGNAAWKDVLVASRMRNILDDADVKRHCLQVATPDGQPVPGIVIPFTTTIQTGVNFFGLPLAGGDHTFTPTSFATKIRSSGIAIAGYVGMAAPSTTDGATGGAGATTPPDPYTGFTDPNALSATPYIYLIPAGADSMRSPPLADTSTVRTWQVVDQAIPLPFNIGNSDYAINPGFLSSDSLTEQAFTIRKHQAFRAVPEGTDFPGSRTFTSSRLIGRSAWNSRWKIVIPGNTLLADPNQGLQTFINTVTDIQLHLETYSYSGN